MGERTVYFCDWCEAEPLDESEIPPDWRTDPMTGELRCPSCDEARTKALTEARAARWEAVQGAADERGEERDG